jgi:hypothetical protein
LAAKAVMQQSLFSPAVVEASAAVEGNGVLKPDSGGGQMRRAIVIAMVLAGLSLLVSIFAVVTAYLR